MIPSHRNFAVNFHFDERSQATPEEAAREIHGAHDEPSPAEGYAVKVNGQYFEALISTGLRKLEQQAADLDARNAVLSLDNVELRKALADIRHTIADFKLSHDDFDALTLEGFIDLLDAKAAEALHVE